MVISKAQNKNSLDWLTLKNITNLLLVDQNSIFHIHIQNLKKLTCRGRPVICQIILRIQSLIRFTISNWIWLSKLQQLQIKGKIDPTPVYLVETIEKDQVKPLSELICGTGRSMLVVLRWAHHAKIERNKICCQP